MSTAATISDDLTHRFVGPHASPSQRVAVLFEPGRSGAAALRTAVELAEPHGELSVLTLAPQAQQLPCCGGGGAATYNCAVRDDAKAELRQARRLLQSARARATFTVLVGHPDPPLATWVAAHAIDIVVLAPRRFSLAGGRLARSVRRATSADVRLIS